ncbi:unnamed protein product [Oppiella nova]|uniref:Ig-like domain-containing protein n=1 Tax=Oppiella nova TaxID=334625 RepID=A0A7R9LI87_9ACAR|nr:unnamed protein product [Oppiella nova]CAG2163908.1 unnamed protein product [Oppiella nova]
MDRYRRGVPINALSDVDKHRITISPTDWSLHISNTTFTDIGNWRCELPDNSQVFTIFKVRPEPQLHPFDKHQSPNYQTITRVVGDWFKLKCLVKYGYSRDATVHWYMYNESEHDKPNKTMVPVPTGDNSTHVRIEKYNDTLSYLAINELDLSDRQYYVCIARNGVAETNNTVLLKVIDKWAAFWPFTGILVITLTILGMLFIYEKCRTKPVVGDTSADNYQALLASEENL